MTEFHPELRRVARLLPRPVITRVRRRPALERIVLGIAKACARGVDSARVNPHVTVLLHEPARPTGRAMLWVHGGGYIQGSPHFETRTCRTYAQSLDCLVAAVDYRLAPEHLFPAALEDCYDALLWLAARPEVDPSRIVIAGASAGAGLVAALAQLARDRGEVVPAAQLLIYPMLDDRTAVRRDMDRLHRVWTNASNRFGWSSYTGREPGDPEMPRYAVPARTEDLTDLPPAWLGVGTVDLFHDEDLTYARRLQAAGVPCTVEVVPGAFHAFDLVRRNAPVSTAFLASQLRTLDGYLSGQ